MCKYIHVLPIYVNQPPRSPPLLLEEKLRRLLNHLDIYLLSREKVPLAFCFFSHCLSGKLRITCLGEILKNIKRNANYFVLDSAIFFSAIFSLPKWEPSLKSVNFPSFFFPPAILSPIVLLSIVKRVMSVSMGIGRKSSSEAVL